MSQGLLFIGIDGGGTSTRACLTDGACNVIATGHGGPSSVDSAP